MKRVLSTFAVLTLLTGAAHAGNINDPKIQKREQNLENRIEQGEKSGQLTPREDRKVRREQNRLLETEAKMKEDGKLTQAERNKLGRMENRESRDVYRLKHNDRKVAPAQ